MKLNRLVKTDSEYIIDHLMLDSRDRVKNGMFFCLKGLTVDGHRFVHQAIENGAIAIVHSDDLEPIDGIEFIRVDDVMTELHRITDRFYNSPSKDMYVYGITGTNGKSTTMITVRNILKRFGVNAGYIGTISVEYNDHKFAPSLTTPDIVELQEYLHDMRSEGVEEVCLEVSSQGLALRRVESIDFDNASFTNLTHDHLDYHKTMANYFEAKKMLFDGLKPTGYMVINIDNEYGEILTKQGYSNVVTYGIENERADYRAKNIVLNEDSTEFTLVYQEKSYPVVTNFVAIFNVYNTLNVIAILHERGYALERIIPELKDIEHVDGRQTMVKQGQPFRVVVDFGHAPDSMKNVYEFVRETQSDSGRIITVFGAAGGRDTAKRPIMGHIASTYCDHVIITEHDNRDERVEDITKDIISGIEKDNYEFVPKRVDAIEKALKMAQPDDTVVLIGKGEEKFIYREHGSKEPWMGDEVCATQILERLYGGK